VRIVLVDDDETVASKALDRLTKLGYGQVRVLRGGVPAWKEAGLPLFAGVHVPSKAFGELAEHAYGTPSVTAAELARMIDQGEDVLILDGRPVAEYRKMNIPGAYCCPNGELPFRIHRMLQSDHTRLVVNCAGRTRSIIGAQTLINLGITNPVFALENGTQGWTLGGLELERGSDRRYPEIDPASSAARDHPMRVAAERLADRCGVPRIAAATVQDWLIEAGRTTLLLDVRTPEEHARETLEGAINAPGGQLLQATDSYVGVRKARLVLFDNGDVRALVVASWLRQMGHDAVVLAGGLPSALRQSLRVPPRPAVDRTPLTEVSVTDVLQLKDAGEAAVVDLRNSMDYRRGHIPGSRWSIRPRLRADLAREDRRIVVVADEAEVAELAVAELPAQQRDKASLLAGGLAAWQATGLPVVGTPEHPADEDCIDYLFFVHDRHAGNLEAARQYLAWEMGLVDALHPQDRAVFNLPSAGTHRQGAGH
jgi:rhodanese-related sulfurtransferase